MEVYIDDQSPQIVYSGPGPGWRRDSTGDAKIVQYLSNTFSATWTEDDMAEITFRGVGITVIGAKRDNHGVYTVKLDGKDAGSYSSYSEVDTMQTVLYSVADLDPAQPHVLQITNKPSLTTPKPKGDSQSASKWLDIDGMIITGQATGVVVTTIYDDRDDAFVYSDQWIPRNPALASDRRYANTSHGTTTNGQYVDFKFTGSSVQIFGALNVDHGNYSIILDGAAPATYDGKGYRFSGNTSLYVATSLEEGPHTVRLTNLGADGQWLDVDFGVVNSTTPAANISNVPVTSTSSTVLTGSSSTSTILGAPSTSLEVVPSPNSEADRPLTAAVSGTGASETQSRSASSNNHSPIIAGAVSGALILLFLLLLSTFVYRRRKRRQAERDSMTDFFTPHDSRDSLYTIEKSGIVHAVQKKGGQAWMQDLTPPRKAATKGFAARTISKRSRTSYNTTVAGQSPFTQGLGSSRGRR